MNAGEGFNKERRNWGYLIPEKDLIRNAGLEKRLLRSLLIRENHSRHGSATADSSCGEFIELDLRAYFLNL